MRSETEMMELILTKAQKDDRIIAVIMNGSRVNMNIERDPFQDFDIIYVVSDLQSFTNDHSWIDYFGERLIMQMPDEMQLYPEDKQNKGRFAYLMKFKDGHRIDLTLLHENHIPDHFDSLSKVLFDKKGLLPKLPEPNESDYYIKKPSAQQLANCANEFWWVSTYVAKGLWRRQLPYAKTMMEGPVRLMLAKMLTWYIGVTKGFQVNVGSSGKYFEDLLPSSLWNLYIDTYADGSYISTWNALFTMCDLFEKAGDKVANTLDYDAPKQPDVYAYLVSIKKSCC